MSDTTYDFQLEDGTKATYTDKDMWEYLIDGPLPTGVTISVKESRQRAKFVMTERFISMPIDAKHMVDLINRCTDPVKRRTLRSWLFQALQKNVMEAEEWLHMMIEGMMGKSGAQQFLRDPNNPWVRAGWDLTQGMRNSGLFQAGGDA